MRRLRQVVSLVFVVGFVLASTAQAQSKTLHWERFDVNITVLPTGDFVVEEIQEILFTSGQFHFGYRSVPMGRLDEIIQVEVWEGNRQYTPGSGDEYTFSTRVESGDYEIKWYFPYTSNSSHTYVLRYTVRGGLRYYDDGDQLYWKAVYAARDFPVSESIVSVSLPDGVIAGPVAAYGTDAQVSGQGSNRVTFEATESVSSGQEFEVRVQWPHGAVQGTKAKWQAAEDNMPLVDLGLGLLGALLLVGGLLLVVLLWYLRGRDPRVAIPATLLTKPPSDAPPGVAGTLVDEKADMEDIIATLVDLARRGYLRIVEEQSAGFLGASSYDFSFRRANKATGGLLTYERTLLKRVFGRGTERSMSALRNKFYTAVPKIQDQIYKETVTRKYFRASPSKTRKRYTGLGVGLLIVAGAAGFCMMSGLSAYSAGAAICPALGLGVTAIGLVIVARVMPAKTRLGSEHAARWEAFKRYLSEIERHTDLDQATDLFEEYLPYAIAFGLDRTWVKKFSRLESAVVPVPTW